MAGHDAEHTSLWGLKLHVCASLLNFHKDWDIFEEGKKKGREGGETAGVSA